MNVVRQILIALLLVGASTLALTPASNVAAQGTPDQEAQECVNNGAPDTAECEDFVFEEVPNVLPICEDGEVGVDGVACEAPPCQDEGTCVALVEGVVDDLCADPDLGAVLGELPLCGAPLPCDPEAMPGDAGFCPDVVTGLVESTIVGICLGPGAPPVCAVLVPCLNPMDAACQDAIESQVPPACTTFTVYPAPGSNPDPCLPTPGQVAGAPAPLIEEVCPGATGGTVPNAFRCKEAIDAVLVEECPGYNPATPNPIYCVNALDDIIDSICAMTDAGETCVEVLSAIIGMVPDSPTAAFQVDLRPLNRLPPEMLPEILRSDIAENPSGQPTLVRLTAQAPVACTVDIKRAGESGGDFARYHTYSDLDDDGASDFSETNGGGEPLDSCPLPGTDEIFDALDELLLTLSDQDFDGLLDCQEVGAEGTQDLGGPDCNGLPTYHTNPDDEDTDGDGSRDGIEAAVGSDPNDPEETPADKVPILPPVGGVNTQDIDGDGLKDDEEADRGTNPSEADTDNDGLTDCQETGFSGLKPNNGKNGLPLATVCRGLQLYHTDPVVADSDDDGALDGAEANGRFAHDECADFGIVSTTGIALVDELVRGLQGIADIPLVADMLAGLAGTALDSQEASNVCVAQPTNPTDPDTDDDGLQDGAEVGLNGAAGDGQYATSPVNPDSDGDALKDGEEPALGTDNLEADTDDDGLDDCVEGGYVPYGTAPNNAPTDLTGDRSGHSGINAALSALRDCNDVGTPPVELNTYFTSPLDGDSDGDTIGDADEVNGRDLMAPSWALTGLDPDVDSLWDNFVVVQADVKTNPSSTDTDGDSWADCAEVGFKPNSNLESSSLLGILSAGTGSEAEVFTSRYVQPVALVERPSFILEFNCPLTNDYWWTSPTELDSDDDGVSDLLEIAGSASRSNFGNPTVADTDNDGLKDCQEVVPRPRSTPLPDDLLEHGFEPSALDITVGPACRDLDNIATVIGVTYQTSPRTGDSDDDGPRDLAEINDGTNPVNRHHLTGDGDADLDGLKDCQEVGRGYGWGTAGSAIAIGSGAHISTNAVPSVVDFNDTVTDRRCTNAAAQALPRYVTAPNDLDSDNDDLNDFEEIRPGEAYGPSTSHSNPTMMDTDGDGNFDCEEMGYVPNTPIIGAENDPLGRCKDDTGSSNGHQSEPERQTNPRKVDSDEDGLGDGFEDDTHATNPTFIDTDGDRLSDCQERAKVNRVPLTGTALVVTPAMEPIASGITCPVHPNMLGAGKAFLTDSGFTDSDKDTLLDGDELEDGTNPTIPFDWTSAAGDPICAETQVAETCFDLALAAAVGAPISGLNTLRAPDPSRLDDSECNFLDPLGWGYPFLTYEGSYARFDETDPEDTISNGLIDWQDPQGRWLLWNGSGCNDLGDPDDDENVGDAPGSPSDQHFGNYVLAVIQRQDVAGLQADAQALLNQALGGTYDGLLVDRLDPMDIDSDGATNEPNGQIDAVEDRLLVIDLHGPAGAAFPLNDGSTGTPSGDKGQFSDSAAGVTFYLRDPRNQQLRGTVTAYAAPPQPLLVVEVLTSAWSTVCISPTPAVVGPFEGRFTGSCAGSLPKPDSDGDGFADVTEQAFDDVFGGDTEQDPDVTPLDTMAQFVGDFTSPVVNAIVETCAGQTEAIGPAPNPIFVACEVFAGNAPQPGDPCPAPFQGEVPACVPDPNALCDNVLTSEVETGMFPICLQPPPCDEDLENVPCTPVVTPPCDVEDLVTCLPTLPPCEPDLSNAPCMPTVTPPCDPGQVGFPVSCLPTLPPCDATLSNAPCMPVVTPPCSPTGPGFPLSCLPTLQACEEDFGNFPCIPTAPCSPTDPGFPLDCLPTLQACEEDFSNAPCIPVPPCEPTDPESCVPTLPECDEGLGNFPCIPAGPADDDGDGVPDEADACPEPGPFAGCAEPPVNPDDPVEPLRGTLGSSCDDVGPLPALNGYIGACNTTPGTGILGLGVRLQIGGLRVNL